MLQTMKPQDVLWKQFIAEMRVAAGPPNTMTVVRERYRLRDAQTLDVIPWGYVWRYDTDGRIFLLEEVNAC